MAMNGTQMGDEIWEAIKTTTGVPYTPANEAKAKVIWEAIANAIVNHIKTNAEVPPNTLAIVPALIIAPEHAGPCTGDGSVTVGFGKVQ